jgi:hypothetical protein
MGLIFTLILFVGLAAIIVWIADWTSGTGLHPTAMTFSIDALLAARSTGPNTKRNAN